MGPVGSVSAASPTKSDGDGVFARVVWQLGTFVRLLAGGQITNQLGKLVRIAGALRVLGQPLVMTAMTRGSFISRVKIMQHSISLYDPGISFGLITKIRYQTPLTARQQHLDAK
jgi:hypothetical protein